MSALSEYLRKSNTRELSTRAIASRAEQGGYALSIATVSRYFTGKHPEPPKAEVLDALAHALGISKENLYQAASLPNPGAPFTLPADAALLDDYERQAVLGVVNAFIRGKHATTPEPAGNTQLRPDLYQNHQHLIDKYGKDAYKHQYDLAARRQEPGDDIEEIYE